MIARLAGAAVNPERHCEVAGGSLGIAEISQCGATGPDRFPKNPLQRLYEALPRLRAYAAHLAPRIDAGPEQRFASVYVANPGDGAGVHQ